jgi:diguanylate cyclase (GGDEF)-like protein
MNSATLTAARSEPLAGAPVRAQDLTRQGLKRWLWALPVFAVAMATAIAVAALNLAPWWPVWLLLAYTGCGLLVFYGLLVSGVAARFRDPLLTLPQVIFGIVLVALSYALLEVTRAVAMEWLCLIMVYDMRRLPKREIWLSAALAMILPALALCGAWSMQPGQSSIGDQLVLLALGVFMVPVLLAVSASVRRLRSRRLKQQVQMAQTLEKLRQMAVLDGLTGLCNRRHMMDLLAEEVRRYQRAGRPFCVAMLDIDHFKRVNDHYGHALGDVVLRHFAAITRAAFQGRTDVVARWGGEEFLVLMPETTSAQAHAALMRLRALVLHYDWAAHEPTLLVSFSAGLSEYGKDRPLTQILEEADEALYRAKDRGRDRVEAIEPLTPQELAASLAGADKALLVLPDVAQFLPASGEASQFGDSGDVAHGHPTRRSKRWMAWILGRDPALADALRLSAVSVGIYAVLMLAMEFYGVPSGSIPRQWANVFLVAQALAATVPYMLVRSGWSARWRTDRALVVPQLWVASALLALAFAVLPATRVYDLQQLCVVLVFGFIDLRPRQAVSVGLGAIGMLVLAYLGLLVVKPEDFLPVREGIQVLVTSFILALLTVQSRSLALARDEARQEKRALVEATEQVRLLTMHDALTGLFNRQHMQGLLERECERHERSGHAFCVALIDLDHFKNINDTHGHQVGDEALSGFAAAARAALRDTDVIGRWGGEEFLALLVETDASAKGLVGAERLRARMAAMRLCPSLPDLQVTFSAGVVERRSGDSVTGLLERADQALYRAKAQGRNCCVQG